MTTPTTKTIATTQTLSHSKRPLKRSKAGTLQNVKLKNNSSHSTSLTHRIVKLTAQIAVGLVATPLMTVAISVTSIFVYSSITYKTIYENMLKNSLIIKYIIAATVIPIFIITITPFFSMTGIIDGISVGIATAQTLSLQPFKKKVNEYRTSFLVSLYPNLYYDDGTSIL